MAKLSTELLHLFAHEHMYMITKQHLEDGALWTIFKGQAEYPGPVVWDLFYLDGVQYPPDVGARMRELHVLVKEPEWDSDGVQPRDPVDDLDAALLHLRAGGTLCKVPDAMDSKYWRLLVVETPEGSVEGDKNFGGSVMLIESPPPGASFSIEAGRKSVQVRTLAAITRKTAPEVFPAYGFDPVGSVDAGTICTLPGATWLGERFTSRTAAIVVPASLTECIRKLFPTCRWSLVGMRVYAVLEGRVVGVINDGVMESW